METIKSYNYKKILEGVVDIINATEKSDIGFANICAYIGENCPELKEREDSRMKQAFIRLVKAYHGVNFPTPEGFTRDDMLAWLEKQGEQTPNKIELNFKVSDYGQKSAWSEEDDDNMMLIEDRLGDYLEYIMEDSTLTKHKKNTVKEAVFEYMNWLKSLKERYTWKPSEGHIKALEDAIYFLGCTRKVSEDLKSLYEQLKKLKGEE